MDHSPVDKSETWREFLPGPVQSIYSPQGQPSFRVLRLDLLKSWASGNKYYKLKYGLKDALAQGTRVVVSKGGCLVITLLRYQKPAMLLNCIWWP